MPKCPPQESRHPGEGREPVLPRTDQRVSSRVGKLYLPTVCIAIAQGWWAKPLPTLQRLAGFVGWASFICPPFVSPWPRDCGQKARSPYDSAALRLVIFLNSELLFRISWDAFDGQKEQPSGNIDCSVRRLRNRSRNIITGLACPAS